MDGRRPRSHSMNKRYSWTELHQAAVAGRRRSSNSFSSMAAPGDNNDYPVDGGSGDLSDPLDGGIDSAVFEGGDVPPTGSQRPQPPTGLPPSPTRRFRAPRGGSGGDGFRRRQRTVSGMMDRLRRNSNAPELSPVDVSDVAGETSAVVTSFMVQRFEREESCPGEEEGATAAPVSLGDMRHVFEHANGGRSQYADIGRRLAVIGDDINERYRSQFDDMICQMRLNPSTAYDAFAEVARRVIGDGPTWGRVVALLCFGFRMAVRVIQNGWTGFVRKIVSYVCDFIIRSGLANWIAGQGGWRAIMSYVDEGAGMRRVAIVAVAAAVCLGVIFWSRRSL